MLEHVWPYEAEDDCKWVTMRGTPVCIRPGEDPEDAAARAFGDDGSKPIKIPQPRGDVVGMVNVDGEEIPYGDDGKIDAISSYRDANDLWDEVDVGKQEIWSDTPSKLTAKGEKLERGMKEWGATDMPEGSVYLTRDGTWVGGHAINGYDEDHRPQIRAGLATAGIKITGEGSYGRGPDGKGSLDATEEMRAALDMSGMVRAGMRGDSMNFDIVHPLSTDQRNAIQDQMISRGVSIDDVVIDPWGRGSDQVDRNTERIKRMLDPDF